MSDVQQQIRHLLVHRHSAEALELYTLVMKYAYRRVVHVTSGSTAYKLTKAEVEDLVSEVMLQLINGSLAQFRGNTIPELLGFVRTVTDRRVWRDRTKRIKSHEMMRSLKAETERHPNHSRIALDTVYEFDVDTPLSQEDQAYLAGLIEAGSKAEYARRNSLSRAAVTQRVKRIVNRIELFTENEQMAVQSWMQKVARTALASEMPGLPTQVIIKPA